MNKPHSKPDDGLRAEIVKHLPILRGSAVLWVSVESSSTASGIPDLYGCWRGRHVWVECKSTSGWKPVINEFQVGFQVRLARAGGVGFVATRRRHGGGPRLGAPVDELWVHAGEGAGLLRGGGLRAAEPVLQGEGGVTRWDWEKVGGVLFGGSPEGFCGNTSFAGGCSFATSVAKVPGISGA